MNNRYQNLIYNEFLIKDPLYEPYEDDKLFESMTQETNISCGLFLNNPQEYYMISANSSIIFPSFRLFISDKEFDKDTIPVQIINHENLRMYRISIFDPQYIIGKGSCNYPLSDIEVDALVKILNDNYNDIVYHYNYDIADWFKCAKKIKKNKKIPNYSELK